MIFVILFGIGFLGLFLCGVMHIRNQLVYDVCIQALHSESDTPLVDSLPTYNRMLWQFTKWKYSHWVQAPYKSATEL